MMCQTLSTLRANNINAIVFVMSNHVYAIEQAFVNLDAFRPGGKFAPYDVLPVWNYVALAEGFGAKGFRVETVGDLERVLNEELKHETKLPALVEVAARPAHGFGIRSRSNGWPKRRYKISLERYPVMNCSRFSYHCHSSQGSIFA